MKPKWRNWQTRQLQELVPVREWRFKSSLRHIESKGLRAISPESFFFSKSPQGAFGGLHRDCVGLFFVMTIPLQNAP